MKLAVRRFCDEGHDGIQAARDIREALLQRAVKGVTAAVCEVNEKQRTIDVVKITAHTITLSLDREEFALGKHTLWEKARVSTTATFCVALRALPP